MGLLGGIFEKRLERRIEGLKSGHHLFEDDRKVIVHSVLWGAQAVEKLGGTGAGRGEER